MMGERLAPPDEVPEAAASRFINTKLDIVENPPKIYTRILYIIIR
jgi:hypothetical protein